MQIKELEKTFTKKEKKRLRKKMKKGQIENLEKSQISEISEKLFRVFLFPSFRFCHTTKIRNSDLKISEKNFRDFRGFQVFELDDFKCGSTKFHKQRNDQPNISRSSYQRCSIEMFTRYVLCKVVGVCNFVKKRLQHR